MKGKQKISLLPKLPIFSTIADIAYSLFSHLKRHKMAMCLVYIPQPSPKREISRTAHFFYLKTKDFKIFFQSADIVYANMIPGVQLHITIPMKRKRIADTLFFV